MNLKRNVLGVPLCIVLIILLASCGGTTQKFTYSNTIKDISSLSAAPVYGKISAAVVPFDDNRIDDRVNYLGYSWIFMFPIGWAHNSKPEEARDFATISNFNCNVREDFAKAFAVNLKNRNLFEDVYFISGGEKKEKAKVIFGGLVNTLYYGGHETLYGLSCFGSLFWLFGAPIGTSYNKVEITLFMKNRETNQVLWTYTFTDESSHVQGIYYNNGDDVKDFSTMIETGYNNAILDLTKKIREKPKMLQ